MWGWIFFFMIHSYYSGVMLAFFMTDPKLPFESLDEAVENFPEWSIYLNEELIAMKNDILPGFKQPDYKRYSQALHTESEKYLVSLTEGIKLLEEPKSIMLIEKAALLSFNVENPGKLSKFAMFGCDSLKPSAAGMIFPKGSPVKKIFHRISLKTLRSGQTNILMKRYFGPELTKQESELAPVTMGQIFTLFCFIGLIVLIAGFFYGCEVLQNHLEKRKNTIQKPKET